MSSGRAPKDGDPGRRAQGSHQNSPTSGKSPIPLSTPSKQNSNQIPAAKRYIYKSTNTSSSPTLPSQWSVPKRRWRPTLSSSWYISPLPLYPVEALLPDRGAQRDVYLELMQDIGGHLGQASPLRTSHPSDNGARPPTSFPHGSIPQLAQGPLLPRPTRVSPPGM